MPVHTVTFPDSSSCARSSGRFNVYEAGSSGPVLLCIHGGGYTGMSWALFASKLKDRCGSARRSTPAAQQCAATA